MSRYRVVLVYSTSLEYEVSAKNKTEAVLKGEKLAEKTFDRGLVNGCFMRIPNEDVVEIVRK